jgi:hypothetical protein
MVQDMEFEKFTLLLVTQVLLDVVFCLHSNTSKHTRKSCGSVGVPAHDSETPTCRINDQRIKTVA